MVKTLCVLNSSPHPPVHSPFQDFTTTTRREVFYPYPVSLSRATATCNSHTEKGSINNAVALRRLLFGGFAGFGRVGLHSTPAIRIEVQLNYDLGTTRFSHKEIIERTEVIWHLRWSVASVLALTHFDCKSAETEEDLSR